MPRFALLFVMLLPLPAASAADVYKWTDAAGIVHYSDAIPSPDLKAERMRVGGSVKPVAAAEREKVASAPPADANPAATAVPVGSAQAASIAKTRCDQARSSLEVLHGNGPVGLDTAGKGKPVPLDDAERQAEVGRAQTLIATFCK